MRKGYDQKCYDLAAAFLGDVKFDDYADQKRLADRLAQEIQDLIENFIEYERRWCSTLPRPTDRSGDQRG